MKRFLNGLSLLLVLLFLTVVLLGAYFLPILAEMKSDELNVDVLMNRDLHISFASLVVMLMIILASCVCYGCLFAIVPIMLKMLETIYLRR